MRTHWKLLGRSAHLLEMSRTNHNFRIWWFTPCKQKPSPKLTYMFEHTHLIKATQSYKPKKQICILSFGAVTPMRSNPQVTELPLRHHLHMPSGGDDVTWHTERMYKWKSCSCSCPPPAVAVQSVPTWLCNKTWLCCKRSVGKHLAAGNAASGASYLMVPPFPPMTSFNTQQYSLGKSCASIATGEGNCTIFEEDIRVKIAKNSLLCKHGKQTCDHEQLQVFMYIYIYTCITISTYICIYIYIFRYCIYIYIYMQRYHNISIHCATSRHLSCYPKVDDSCQS